MSPVFLITLLLIAAIAYTIYRKERRHGATTERELYAARPRSLFPESGEIGSDPANPRALAEAAGADARSALVERASRGDLGALDEAFQLGGAG
ncbi:MAG: hypothetical protein LC785_09515, partial [Acidobacteria bacterium]|nr:hypothetical protein [Acidobacteriota bacterium]MCA1642169.1 hypothetical protein [Acidobacteriota bacterium]